MVLLIIYILLIIGTGIVAGYFVSIWGAVVCTVALGIAIPLFRNHDLFLPALYAAGIYIIALWLTVCLIHTGISFADIYNFLIRK